MITASCAAECIPPIPIPPAIGFNGLAGAAAVNAAVIASACACVIVPFVTKPDRTLVNCGGTPNACPVSALAVVIVASVPNESAVASAAAAIFLFIISLLLNLDYYFRNSRSVPAPEAITSRYP